MKSRQTRVRSVGITRGFVLSTLILCLGRVSIMFVLGVRAVGLCCFYDGLYCCFMNGSHCFTDGLYCPPDDSHSPTRLVT